MSNISKKTKIFPHFICDIIVGTFIWKEGHKILNRIRFQPYFHNSGFRSNNYQDPWWRQDLSSFHHLASWRTPLPSSRTSHMPTNSFIGGLFLKGSLPTKKLHELYSKMYWNCNCKLFIIFSKLSRFAG